MRRKAAARQTATGFIPRPAPDSVTERVLRDFPDSVWPTSQLRMRLGLGMGASEEI